MDTATKNLDIVTRIKGSEQTKAGFDSLAKSSLQLSNTFVGNKGLIQNTQQSNMQLQSLSRIVQDMPYGFMAIGNNITFMAEQMAYAKTQGVGMGAMLKGMASAFIGPGGIIFLISAATSLLTAWKLGAFSAKGSTEELNKELERTKKILDELIKVENPFEKIFFGFKAEELSPALDKINKKIEDYNTQIKSIATPPQIGKGIGLMTWVTELFTSGEIDKSEEARLKRLVSIKDKLQEQADLLKEQIELSNIIEELGGKRTEKEKEKTKEIKDRTMSMEVYVRLLEEANRKEELIESKNRIFRHTIGYEFNLKDQPQKPTLTFTKEEMETNSKLYADLFRDAADVMRSEFGSAWENIFGDANSLFEKLIASWASTFFNYFSNKALGGLLSLIPGAGPVADILGFSKSVSVANTYNDKLRMD